MVNMVTDFVAQFIKIEAKNSQLREELAIAKSSANRLRLRTSGQPRPGRKPKIWRRSLRRSRRS
jgi:hypothetical protein